MISPSTDRPEAVYHGYDDETFIDYEEWLPEFDELDDPLINMSFEADESDLEPEDLEYDDELPVWYSGD